MGRDADYLPAIFFRLTYPQSFFVISEGPIGAEPMTDSSVSLQPLKLIEYPPKAGFFVAIFVSSLCRVGCVDLLPGTSKIRRAVLSLDFDAEGKGNYYLLGSGWTTLPSEVAGGLRRSGGPGGSSALPGPAILHGRLVTLSRLPQSVPPRP